MSDVRWCDIHNGPFPVPTDGWIHSTGTRTLRVDGRVTVQNVEQDVCGKCAGKDEPHYEITSTAVESGKHSSGFPGLDGNDY